MKKNILFFFIPLGWIVLVEGLGLPFGHKIAFLSVYAFPFVLFINKYIHGERLWRLPFRGTVLFGSFILFSVLSTLTSVNLQNSFEYILLYSCMYLLFVYVYNYQSEIEEQLPVFIYTIAGIFSFWTVVLIVFFKSHITFFIPASGYQFVYATFGHNHLGDFLLIPILLLLRNAFKEKKKFYQNLLLIFFCFLLLSYSRSAYLTLLITASLYCIFTITKKHISVHTIILPAISFFAIIFLFFTASFYESTLIPGIKNIHTYLQQELLLERKYVPLKRIEYATEAFQAMREKPFGYGPGNFFYISQQFTAIPYSWTESAHNIFLDISSENGLVAGFILVIWIVMIMVKSKKNVYFFTFLAVFLSFQTDYTYRIHSFLLLFFILIGIIYQEKKEILLGKTLVACCGVILLIFFLIAGSHLAIQHKFSKTSLVLYPLNKQSYEQILTEQEISKNGYDTILQLYTQLFSGDPEVLRVSADNYEKKKEYEKALVLYQKSYIAQPFANFTNIENLYALLLKTREKKVADRFMDTFFIRILSLENPAIYAIFEGKKIRVFCSQRKDYICPPGVITIYF